MAGVVGYISTRLSPSILCNVTRIITLCFIRMQWNVTHRSDGTFKLTNMLLGNDLPMFGLADGTTVPAMNTNEEGAHWTVDINAGDGSSGGIIAAMLATFSSIEVISFFSSKYSFPSRTSKLYLPVTVLILYTTFNLVQTATATTSFTTESAQAAHTTSASSDSRTSVPTDGAQQSASENNSSSISGGAIAGIVIGAVGATLAFVTIFLFLRRRNRRQKQRSHINEGAVLVKGTPDSDSSYADFDSPPMAGPVKQPNFELGDTEIREMPHSTYSAELPSDSAPAGESYKDRPS
jgi:hypothetical protein